MTCHEKLQRSIIRTVSERCFTVIAAFLLCVTMALGQMNTEAIEAALAKTPSVVRVSWWGFDETDSTQAFQAAINSVHLHLLSGKLRPA